MTVALLGAFLIAFVCGLRSMTAPALVCWAAHLGWISLAGSHLAFLGHPVALVIFTLGAIGELIADKLPFVPRRTTPGPLLFRIVLGMVCAVAFAISGGFSPIAFGFLGIAGAIAGAYAGYGWRRSTSGSGRIADWPVALLEDLVAVGGGLLIVSHL
ncbi:DUF4126 family protein [Silvibacterium sp.]|uniref:DUF4126 family protein n=1 Tax=Silvibacterium sp. TaxID=1964179 RepID=UPI0039E6240B